MLTQGMHYKELESVSTATAQTNIFNAPVTGSAIGYAGVVTINNGISIDEALSFIRAQDISTEDKTEAEKMVTYIETLTENEAPLKRDSSQSSVTYWLNIAGFLKSL